MEIIIKMTDNVNWLNRQTTDFDTMENIKIDNKIISVPMAVAMMMQKMNDDNRGLLNQVKNLDIALNKILKNDH